MHINYFIADETADKPYLIRISGKTKLIGLLALSIMIISTLVIVSTNQYGPKAMDYIRINGNIGVVAVAIHLLPLQYSPLGKNGRPRRGRPALEKVMEGCSSMR